MQTPQNWFWMFGQKSRARFWWQNPDRSLPLYAVGGRPPELVDQVVNGVADIIWTVVGYTPGRFPSTEVFELPFMMKDVGALSCAFWTMFEKRMKDTEFADMHILGTWVHGPGVIHTEDPVEEIADLKGMKIRGGSRVVNQLLEQVGATPIGMPVPAVPESLAKGVLNGTTIPWEVTTSLKVPDLVENHTEFEGAALYTLTFIMAMNKEKYASLPADLKAVIDKKFWTGIFGICWPHPSWSGWTGSPAGD